MSVPRLLFLAVLLASLLATALVVQARSPDLALEVPERTKSFSPDGDGHRDTAKLTFYVRQSDRAATIQIVRAGVVVRTIAEREPLAEDERRTVVWDGLTDSGEPAPAGRYRLRVVSPDADRDMIFPRPVELVRSG